MLIPFLVLATPRPIADVPFELRGVHIYVQAKINGQGPFPMNVDTGGFMCISGSLARQLDLKPERTVAGGGAGGNSVTFLWGKVGTVQIGDAVLPNQEGSLGTDEGGPEAGIGPELFKAFTVEFDNDRRRMRLYRKGEAPLPKGATVLPLGFMDEKPLVEASMGGVKGRFMLDTGGGVSVILQKAFWTKHRLDERYRPPVETIVGFGVGGPIFGRVGRLPELKFGTLTLRDPIASYSTMTKGTLSDPQRDGLIGQQVLLHFNSTFDYANRRLILSPSRTFARRDSYSRSGISGLAEGLGYRVYAVQKGGPGEEAGLKAGDVIVRVNDRLVASDDEARAAFRRPSGSRLRLEVLRNDRIVKATLVLRDVL